MNIYYIGSFPPPYGGVTIKNNNLYTALRDEIDIEKIDLSQIKKNPTRLFKLLHILAGRKNKFVVGVAGKNTRKRFSKLLYIMNRKAMNRSILMVMGGTAANDMAKDESYGRYVREYRKIYVETEGMKKTLIDAGICNADIYPNGRFRPDETTEESTTEKLRCVFFSLICEEKGCDEILEVAKDLSEVDFSFYGEIEGSYEKNFKDKVQFLENVQYKGVFSGSPADVFKELSQYDVLLFPTRYKIEGVPGILVEAKISGLAIIASDESYNGEIVADGEAGFILPHNTSRELAEKINIYKNDRELLNQHKKNSKCSADEYFIDRYIPRIVSELGGVTRFKCIYFSLVSKSKGIEVVLRASRQLPETSFDIYGELNVEYADTFRLKIENLSNVNYKGVFSGTDREKYNLLREYDVMLLPTRHHAEGVPGIIVESRIAGIIPVVSRWNFNEELVRDGEDGLLLDEITAEELVEKLNSLWKDYKLYLSMKVRQSGETERYYIDNYVGAIAETLRH